MQIILLHYHMKLKVHHHVVQCRAGIYSEGKKKLKIEEVPVGWGGLVCKNECDDGNLEGNCY